MKHSMSANSQHL